MYHNTWLLLVAVAAQVRPVRQILPLVVAQVVYWLVVLR
jgi:hypothetical protein